MSKTTFGFDEDGNLVEVGGPPGFAFNQNLPMPAIPSFIELQKVIDDLNQRMDLATGVSEWMLINDRSLGKFTSAGYGQQLEVALLKEQRILNGIESNLLKIHASPYVPKTVRRQFRFPRTKKKRIRRKWAKDPRNWREEHVAFFIQTPRETPHDDRIYASGYAMGHNFYVPK
jgi:hypothetical protein